MAKLYIKSLSDANQRASGERQSEAYYNVLMHAWESRAACRTISKKKNDDFND